MDYKSGLTGEMPSAAFIGDCIIFSLKETCHRVEYNRRGSPVKLKCKQHEGRVRGLMEGLGLWVQGSG